LKCADRGFQCPGYDRTVDAFFHDETANVQAKAKISKAKAIAARDARHGVQHPKKPPTPAQAQTQIQIGDPPGLQLMSSLIDQGIAFFMAHYSIGVDQPSIQSAAYHKYLSTDGFHPLVATTMTALGIAGVSNLYMDPSLKREATQWYSNAIKMANAAISSPEEVKADTTLTAVNLLGMFEATFNDNSLSGWSNHVDGAASLVKIRGMDQFSTPAGQRMYLHTVGLLTMNCMGKGKALPQYVRDMNDKLMNYLDIKDPRTAFFFLHIKTIDLRAQILNQRTLSLADIVKSALELDDIALSIFQDKTSDWGYEEVPCKQHPGLFGNFYHVYPTVAAAQTWNWVRYNRIYFHDIIRNSILAGFCTSPPTLVGAEYHEQLAKSTAILYKVQSDIIASMPQFLHDVPKTAPTTPSHDASNYDADSFVPASSWPTPPESPSPNNMPSPPKKQGVPKAFHQNFPHPSQNLVGNGPIADRLPIVRISGGYSTVWALYVVCWITS
jgi:hypothetical protein